MYICTKCNTIRIWYYSNTGIISYHARIIRLAYVYSSSLLSQESLFIVVWFIFAFFSCFCFALPLFVFVSFIMFFCLPLIVVRHFSFFFLFLFSCLKSVSTCWFLIYIMFSRFSLFCPFFCSTLVRFFHTGIYIFLFVSSFLVFFSSLVFCSLAACPASKSFACVRDPWLGSARLCLAQVPCSRAWLRGRRTRKGGPLDLPLAVAAACCTTKPLGGGQQGKSESEKTTEVENHN